MTPRTFGGQIFCIAYAVIGIPLMGFVLSTVYKGVLNLFKWLIRKVGVCRRSHKETSTRHRIIILLFGLLAAFTVIVIVPAILFYYFEGWTFWEATYYCFITISTIGFGDYVVGNYPDHSEITRWLLKVGAVLYITIGLSFMMALGKIAENEFRSSGTRRKAYRIKLRNSNSRPTLHHTKHVCADGSVWTVKDTKYSVPLCSITDTDIIDNGVKIKHSNNKKISLEEETAIHSVEHDKGHKSLTKHKKRKSSKINDDLRKSNDSINEEHMAFSVSSLMLAANAFDD